MLSLAMRTSPQTVKIAPSTSSFSTLFRRVSTLPRKLTIFKSERIFSKIAFTSRDEVPMIAPLANLLVIYIFRTKKSRASILSVSAANKVFREFVEAHLLLRNSDIYFSL